MSEAQYIRRLQEFDGLMKEYHNNPIVHKFAKMYATCELVTKEEALFQMVKHLCANWDEIARRNYNAAMMTFNPEERYEQHR